MREEGARSCRLLETQHQEFMISLKCDWEAKSLLKDNITICEEITLLGRSTWEGTKMEQRDKFVAFATI